MTKTLLFGTNLLPWNISYPIIIALLLFMYNNGYWSFRLKKTLLRKGIAAFTLTLVYLNWPLFISKTCDQLITTDL